MPKNHPIPSCSYSTTYSCGLDANKYKYGFNGKEKDNETNVEGGDYNFGARIYDSRLGRWLSLDPLMATYSPLSPYNFVINNPIELVDPNGQKVAFEQGNDVSNSEHRKMKRQILLMRAFSRNYRRMYREFNRSPHTYTFRSEKKETLDGNSGDYKDGIIKINIDQSDINSIRATIAHESGHVWREIHGMEICTERIPYPKYPRRGLLENKESYDEKLKQFNQERDKIDGENVKNAVKFRETKELEANNIQNIIMADLSRKFFIKKFTPELTYGPVEIAVPFITINGNPSFKFGPGEFKSTLTQDYYNVKRSIYKEYNVKR